MKTNLQQNFARKWLQVHVAVQTKQTENYTQKEPEQKRFWHYHSYRRKIKAELKRFVSTSITRKATLKFCPSPYFSSSCALLYLS